MAKRVEALAEFYRQNGWEEAASVLEADAQRFREAGMPDNFLGQRTRSKKEKRTFTPMPIELQIRLVQILSEVLLPDTATHILQTDGLAEKINQDVGQHVADDTHLSWLWVKGKGTYEEFGDEYAHMGEFRIDKRLVGPFNATLHALIKNRIDTVGLVRTSQYKDFIGLRIGSNSIGEDKIRFIRAALASMNSSQDTPRRSLGQPNDTQSSPRIYHIR